MPSIARVDTSVPAFIGFTAKAGGLVNVPTQIGSLSEYERRFGGREVLPVGVDVDESGGGIAVAVQTSSTPSHFLRECMQLYFANGGGPCYVVSIGDYGTPTAPNDLLMP